MACTCYETTTRHPYGNGFAEETIGEECAECYEARIMREMDDIAAEFEEARMRELEGIR